MLTTSMHLEQLPSAPSPKLTEKYTFLDTRKVVQDMADLGYAVTGVRRPAHRTPSGAYGLHEVEFREPKYIGKSIDQAPRVLFINSYDGSRKAQLVGGIIRFACLNGLILGDLDGNEKFLHVGDFEQDLLDHMAKIAKSQEEAFTKIEHYRSTPIDDQLAIEMAREMAELRFGEDLPTLDFRNLLQPRRAEDLGTDLYTRWNVAQENLAKGGVPVIGKDGQPRLTAPVNSIIRSNDLNREWWNILEAEAELVG